jgi:arginine decarboxylase-like protein
VAREVTDAQHRHQQLMQDIAKKHQLQHVATRELDAVHAHHLLLVQNIVQKEAEEKEQKQQKEQKEQEQQAQQKAQQEQEKQQATTQSTLL